MENCYYLDASSEKGVGKNGDPAQNKEPASEDGIFSKEEDAFQRGEVTWLLNGGSVAEDGTVTEPAGNVWKQGSLGEAGSMPGFTGSDVYRAERCDGAVSYNIRPEQRTLVLSGCEHRHEDRMV